MPYASRKSVRRAIERGQVTPQQVGITPEKYAAVQRICREKQERRIRARMLSVLGLTKLMG